MRRYISTLVPAFLFFTAINAQLSDSLYKDLQTAVVTGQYKPQTLKNSVYNVKVITQDKIRRQSPSNLQDVLKHELNIRFSQDLATGGSDLSMLGLKGQNIKILLNGLPIIGRQGANNEIDINQIDVNSIERIEIVEGPMSVIYGADALAGVINIITKKAQKNSIKGDLRFREESVGKEYGIERGIHNQYASVSVSKKEFEFGGAFGRNLFSGWKDTVMERELIWHKKDQLIANGFLNYTKDRFTAGYRIDGLDEIITNPGNFIHRRVDADDTLAFDAEYLSKRIMQQLNLGYKFNNDLSFSFQSGYTIFGRQVFSTSVSKKTGDIRLNTDPSSQSTIDFSGLNFRLQAVYRIAPWVMIQPGIDLNLETGEGERLNTGVNKQNDYGFFLSAEISPTSKILIRPGLRLVRNSVYDTPPLLPSVNAKFILSDELDLRFSYAQGFRSPSIRELYFNFFDANHQIVGNPDLQAETSNSFNASVTWTGNTAHGLQLQGTANAFYNDVKGLIDFTVSANDPNIFIYSNVDEFKSKGVSVSLLVTGKNFEVNGGVLLTSYFNNFSRQDASLPDFTLSPEVNGSITRRFAEAGIDLNLFYKYTGTKPSYILFGSDIVFAKQRGYHLADITSTWRMSRCFTLQGGIRNLFDVDRVNNSFSISGVHTSSGVRNIAYGRSLFAGIIINWEKK